MDEGSVMEPTPLSPEDIKRGIELGTRLYGYWKQIAAAWGGKKKRIMITGMEGVGKPTLFDYMTGKAYAKGYRAPTTSLAAETGHLKSPDGQHGLIVIPGQESKPRVDAIAATVKGKNPPDGVIHVVANGFATSTTRDQSTTTGVKDRAKLKSIEAYQRYQREREIRDLEQLCGWIRYAQREHRKPCWLLLVVTKYDLFPTGANIDRAYFPGGNSSIVQKLDELTHQVGSDNFTWRTAQVCTHLEDFTWDDQTIKSGMTIVQRDTLIEELVKRIVALCDDGGVR